MSCLHPIKKHALRGPGRKFSGILNMLIVQSTDESKPNPQIGKFLSSGQHSDCGCNRVKQKNRWKRAPFVKFWSEVGIWPQITNSDPILKTWPQDKEVSKVKWKSIPEMWERLVSLLLHCLFANYLHALLLKGHWQMAPLRLYKSLQKE